MRNPKTRYATAGLLVAWSAVAHAEAEKPPAPTCARGDAQMHAGLLAEAQKTYASVIEAGGSNECAQNGLTALAAAHAARGAALKRAGDTEEAKKSLRLAIGIAPTTADAVDTLKALQSLDVLQNAARAHKLQRPFDAAHYAAEADADPHVNLTAEQRETYLAEPFATLLATRRWLGSWFDREPISLGLSVAVCFALLLLGARVVRHPVLELAAADTESVGEKIGKDFASNVRARIHVLTSENVEGQLRVARGPVAADPLEAKVETSTLPAQLKWLNIIPTLLQMISTRSKIAVFMCLHPAGERGPGVTVEVTRRGKTQNAGTLWLATYEKRDDPAQAQAEDYLRLAEYVAIWLLGALRKPNDGHRILGSKHWEAAASLTAALRAETTPEKKRHLRDALKHDPELRAARVNFARLIRSEEDGAKHALDIVASVVGATDDVAPEDDSIYIALYEAADISFTIGKDQDALKYASRLNAAIASAKASKNKATKRYAESIEPQVEIIQIAFEAWTKHTDDKTLSGKLAEIEGKRTGASASANPFLHYNIACAIAHLRPLAKNPPVHPSFDDALDSLARALRLRRDLADDARTELCFDSLRNRPTYAKKLSVLLKAEPDTGRLEWIEGLNDAWRKKLAGLGVRTIEDLVLRATGQPERTHLAAELEVAVPSVDGWAFTADLLRVPSIDAAGLKMLAAAKIAKLDELRWVPTKDLIERIGEAGETAPNPALVEAWTSEAQKLTTIVR